MNRLIVLACLDFRALPKTLRVDLFRVIQQLTAKGILHGRATKMYTRLGGSYPEVRVRILENGNRCDPHALKKMESGLNNIRCRAQSNDGEPRFATVPNQGSEAKIHVWVKS